MAKKIALYKSHALLQVKKQFEHTDNKVFTIENLDSIENYDVVVLYDYNGKLPDNLENTSILNIHPSLLPAFQGEHAIEQTINAGVKVSGITITNPNTRRIIAQYPVLIGIDTHIQELTQELIKLEQAIVPKVLDSIISDKVFDFADLFHNSCNGCTSCKSCHKDL